VWHNFFAKHDRLIMQIDYALEPHLTAEEFRDILVASTLAERRPAGDLARLARMLREADIIVTARHEGRLIGVARALSDFSYSCYLSDLAVEVAYQRRGIGKRLIEETRANAGPEATLVLLSAPAAEGYYPKIGMKKHENCWIVPRAG
jgi:GNAT superfamily N-acetyltransferase